MSLNPPLNPIDGDPFRVAGEHFILHRSGCEFELNIEGLGASLTGRGKMILTTLRLVLVNLDTESGNNELIAFDLPHGNTFKENFI